jgi:hypothetical protein
MLGKLLGLNAQPIVPERHQSRLARSTGRFPGRLHCSVLLLLLLRRHAGTQESVSLLPGASQSSRRETTDQYFWLTCSRRRQSNRPHAVAHRLASPDTLYQNQLFIEPFAPVAEGYGCTQEVVLTATHTTPK